MLVEAALALLGLGPSTGVSLGVMLHWALATESIRTGAWWTFAPPVLLLTLLAFALLSMQASMDAVVNPRLRRESLPRPRRTEPRPAQGSDTLPNSDDVLTASALRAAYATRSGRTVARDGISLALPKGEVLGIAGESGCGKSTLAAVLSLTVQPPLFVLGGELTVAGHRIAYGSSNAQQSAHRGSMVSLLPQVTMSSLPPTRRVGDFAADVVRSHRPDVTRAQARDHAADRLGRLGLPRAVLDRYPHQISGGMAQRVVTGLSTLLDPVVLIADEPTSALDVSTQRRVLSLLRQQVAGGLVQGILLITHDLPILRSIADRVAIMYAGQIVEFGTTDEILNEPQHPYTRALVASVLVPDEWLRTHRVAGIDGSPPDADVRERMSEALTAVGLRPAEALDKYAHQLSGGERQRVMLARALMIRPALLVADEVTSMLDASRRAQILNIIMEQRRERDLAVLFITHDIGQACYVGDRIMVMRRGAVVETGTVDQVIFHPEDAYTRRLLADVPHLRCPDTH